VRLRKELMYVAMVNEKDNGHQDAMGVVDVVSE